MQKFDLKKEGEKKACKGGERVLFRGTNMALASLKLERSGMREPHWHPNANELAYCVQGKALVTLFAPGNKKSSFLLSKGEVAYFPKGFIHHIENTDSEESLFILGYDHGSPEDLNLSASVASMPAHVLASTFNGKEEEFLILTKKKGDTFIAQKKPSSPTGVLLNLHKFNLEAIRPQITTPDGLARIANKDSFPLLNHLALFSLRLHRESIREPHWHPNATELNYVIHGKAELRIFSPDGKVEAFRLNAGQGSLIPAGYFHHIENIGSRELHMAVYFNHCLPSDIGLSGALSAYSNEVLEALFAVKKGFFKDLSRFKKDRMIVPGGTYT